MATREPSPIEVHKALADDTRFRLYRYLGLSGRPVSVRELAARLSLHPNTLRPHLRRLEDVGLVRHETRRSASTVGRPQTLYLAVDRSERGEGGYRLLAEILAAMASGSRARERATTLAAEWGQYLAAQGGPKPGTRRAAGRNLAVLQDALARAGFDPRFRRASRETVEISLRDCPFRDLLDEHRELVCGIHRGLLDGMLAALKPPLEMRSFEPFAERGVCRLVAGERA
jgi:predicted ArsR family transcriptional regulator